jgi:hypothetical protein
MMVRSVRPELRRGLVWNETNLLDEHYKSMYTFA